MNSTPAVFLGTPEFARYHLQSLLDSPRFHIVGVVSQPDRKSGRQMQWKPSAVKKLALENNLEVMTSKMVSSEESLNQIKSWDAKVAIVVAFGQILSQSFLNLFPQRVVNVHGSLLPRWRGAAPIQRALMAGDRKSGVTLQVMVKELDAGDLIGGREISLGSEMNAIELHDHLKVLGVDLLKNELVQYLNGEIEPQPQDPEQVTYAKKINKRESHINWQLTAREIYNYLRGMVLGPGMYTLFRDKKLKIHRAQVETHISGGRPGQVMDIGGDSLVVACGRQALRVFEVQVESRERMFVTDFLRGTVMDTDEVFS